MYSDITHKSQIQNSKEEETISFEWKNGRRLANDQDVAYILPSDQTEVDRLKLNHELWKLVIEGLFKSPIHEKLVQGIRVLDIGCGPGWWSLDMARLYPNSEFIGIDMADVFINQDLPSNVTFKILNAGTTGLSQFEDDSFDFVFQRFLVMGFPLDQYLWSIQEMKRILKPGGSIEILELVNEYKNGGPAFKNMNTWIDKALSSRNMDSFIADKIARFLKEAGYKDIKEIDYDVPIGTWGGLNGEIYLAIQKLALPAVKVMVTELVPFVTNEIYEDNLKLAFEEVETGHISTRFRLIYAFK
ncbi:S-adenosyl-L-methionine-dependent methyltransferase [Cokeromyces recurvatus]|uniref:S-adenosyl-L-methionine-dependent methyltransferase n=1 Tax=Cokeromyces recurvatus TaxID=90255 RepID=UPI00221F1D24|nr:S-adenosyl-L-methionine-dependent methyltransferase [Cokeromyces recurvatus]KAI7900921.1 S-adenosyl-L-methionine-dependent methyltransferase [Cokeromyces recurvatus]